MPVIDKKEVITPFKIGLVASRYNEELSRLLCEGAVERLKELKFQDYQITIAWVPSIVEVPLAAQTLVNTERYEAVICLGVVIKGETNFYDALCQQVSMGCQRVSLDHGIPLVFGILTTQTEEQARARIGGQHGHKGREVVDHALEIVSVMRSLRAYE